MYDNLFKQVKTELCEYSLVQLRQPRTNVSVIREDMIALGLELSSMFWQLTNKRGGKKGKMFGGTMQISSIADISRLTSHTFIVQVHARNP